MSSIFPRRNNGPRDRLRTSVDINSLKEMEDPRLFDEFEQWFAGNIIIDYIIRKSHNFFQVLLRHTLIGWLRDEVSVVKYNFLKFC